MCSWKSIVRLKCTVCTLFFFFCALLSRLQVRDSRWVKVKRWFIYKRDQMWNIYTYIQCRVGNRGRSKLLFTQPVIHNNPLRLMLIHSRSMKKANREGSREVCAHEEKLTLAKSTGKTQGNNKASWITLTELSTRIRQSSARIIISDGWQVSRSAQMSTEVGTRARLGPDGEEWRKTTTKQPRKKTGTMTT